MYVIIFITTASKNEAQEIAHGILKRKIAACVNIVDNVKSLFWWESKIDSAKEVLLMVKSKRSKLNKIIKFVKSVHSYDVPEIIALPIIGGFKPYLEWIDGSVS